MTVKVQLKPEVEAELLAEAREKGLSLECRAGLTGADPRPDASLS